MPEARGRVRPDVGRADRVACQPAAIEVLVPGALDREAALVRGGVTQFTVSVWLSPPVRVADAVPCGSRRPHYADGRDVRRPDVPPHSRQRPGSGSVGRCYGRIGVVAAPMADRGPGAVICAKFAQASAGAALDHEAGLVGGVVGPGQQQPAARLQGGGQEARGRRRPFTAATFENAGVHGIDGIHGSRSGVVARTVGRCRCGGWGQAWRSWI